ncbi:hypothetical protein D3871_11385 [Noviherbaspirillum saxi]|uniref:Phage regulatory protein CII (CP76) n=2 Tax=Noviherbaspirillum saxi TaxID=2320863 RepID=A0A3A3FS59_9BURK|nr:hypothetical protein D3871_11385 [Noviherbaspirillum saxi]
MNVQDAFYHTVHDYKGGTAELAGRLDMSQAILLNKADPNKEHNKPLLKDADRVMGLTADYRILHALAENHGHVCFKVDRDTHASDLAILELVTKVWQSNGDVGTAVHNALADGRVDHKEIAQVRQAIYRTQQSLNEMLMRLEGMAEK